MAKTIGQQRVSDAAFVAYKTGLAAVGAPSTSAAVSSLLVAAGASNAAPVAGQIIAVGSVTAAGIIALVGVLREAKARRKVAVELAETIGFDDAPSIPAFTVRALKLDRINRLALRDSISQKVDTKSPFDIFEKPDKLKLKLALLDTVELMERAQERGYMPPSNMKAATAEYEPWFGPGTDSRKVALWGGGFFFLAGAIVLLSEV